MLPTKLLKLEFRGFSFTKMVSSIETVSSAGMLHVALQPGKDTVLYDAKLAVRMLINVPTYSLNPCADNCSHTSSYKAHDCMTMKVHGD